jgi:hypothetical protein
MTWRRQCFRLSAAIAWLGLATPAYGQVRGMYGPGSALTDGGTLPDPGFAFSDQFWSNTSSSLKGSQGNPLPLQNSVTVSSNTVTLTYVPQRTMLGAHVEFSISFSTTTDSFLLRDPLPGGPSLTGGGAGLTNTNVQPFTLGWQFDRIDVQTGYSFYAPTGRYVPGASDNTSSGFWTHSWQSGVTWYLNESRRTQVSAYNAYLWNTVQEGTGIHAGQNDSIDYSVSQTIAFTADARWSLQAGAAGYGQWQTTENGGQLPIREALKYRVNGAGITLTLTSPFRGFFVAGSALWEYRARNTYEGRTVTLTGGFNIS